MKKYKGKQFAFQTNESIKVPEEPGKLSQFFDSMKITMIDMAYKTAKKMFLYFLDLKIYSDKEQAKIETVTKRMYDYIHSHGGVYCPRLTQNEKISAKKYLDKELNKHLTTLKELYPFVNFEEIDEKSKDIAYRVILDNHNTNLRIDGLCCKIYPLVCLMINKNNNYTIPGICTLKHEFTHFCAKSNLFSNPDICVPSFLDEGLTQMITKKCFIHENYDEDIVFEELDGVYTPNTKLAELYYLVFSDLIIESYFEDDMSYIGTAFMLLLEKYPCPDKDSLIYDPDFDIQLWNELEDLSDYVDREETENGVPSTEYLDTFLDYLSFVAKIIPDDIKGTAISRKIGEFRYSLSHSINQIERS